MSELHSAYELTRAINEVEALKLFPICAENCEMFLTWSNGSALGGYKELSAAMSIIVSERWSEIRDEAIRRAEVRLEKAREGMRSALPTADKP